MNLESTFSPARYTDGRSDPQIVLAVGPNIIWEFFNIGSKTSCGYRLRWVRFYCCAWIIRADHWYRGYQAEPVKEYLGC